LLPGQEEIIPDRFEFHYSKNNNFSDASKKIAGLGAPDTFDGRWAHIDPSNTAVLETV
jgi:hypothetical protein